MLYFRPLVSSDQAALWHWLHVALWDPPPTGLRPREVLERPDVRIYAESWGRPGDVGSVAVVDDQDAGACWIRLFPSGIGLASVNDKTPQLGIALEPVFQRRGTGTKLLLETLSQAWRAGYTQVALTVHPQNPAVRVYERCGFRKVDVRHGYHLMVVTQPKTNHPANSC
jgi:GNAT superfamily N-acetyltransferase